MATTLVENRKNGASLERFTGQQRMFVLYLLADEEYCPTRAARKTGAKNPKLQANRWLKIPHVAAFLGKDKREREERTEISSDEVWRFLRLARRPLAVSARTGMKGRWHCRRRSSSSTPAISVTRNLQ